MSDLLFMCAIFSPFPLKKKKSRKPTFILLPAVERFVLLRHLVHHNADACARVCVVRLRDKKSLHHKYRSTELRSRKE